MDNIGRTLASINNTISDNISICKMYNPLCASDIEYCSLLYEICHYGERDRPDRTGVGTISMFGATLRFELLGTTVPLLTIKRMPWKTIIEELLWFLKGHTDSKLLECKGINIWKGNSSMEFLRERGLPYREGDIGPGYGFQWRHFGAEYKGCDADYTGQGVDQIAEVLNLLKNDPFSRRIIISAWNPAAISMTALPPCHYTCQFYVSNTTPRRLSCILTQRSADVGLGLPFNIFSYATLLRIFALKCGYVAHTLTINIGDSHVYNNHVDALTDMLQRPIYPAPDLIINDSVIDKNIEDITIDDFRIENYQHGPTVHMEMAV
jgi:thymidylate synthase